MRISANNPYPVAPLLPVHPGALQKSDRLRLIEKIKKEIGWLERKAPFVRGRITLLNSVSPLYFLSLNYQGGVEERINKIRLKFL